MVILLMAIELIIIKDDKVANVIGMNHDIKSESFRLLVNLCLLDSVIGYFNSFIDIRYLNYRIL